MKRKKSKDEATPELMKERVAASVFIYNTNDMNSKDREAIAEWLMDQAKFLILHGEEMDKTFRARYFCG